MIPDDGIPRCKDGRRKCYRWLYPNRIVQLQRTLVNRVRARLGYNRDDVREVTKVLWEELKILLLAGKEINLKDFGIFYVIRVSPYTCTRNGTTFRVRGSARVGFRPSKLLLRHLAYYGPDRPPPPFPMVAPEKLVPKRRKPKMLTEENDA